MKVGEIKRGRGVILKTDKKKYLRQTQLNDKHLSMSALELVQIV